MNTGGSILDDLLQGEIIPGSSVNPVVEALTRAEIDSQIATAKKYPRSLDRFYKDAVQMACMNESVASSIMYSIPRDGKQITGPSVRMSEIVASAFGNIRVEARIVEIGDDSVTARAMCLDLERNNAQTVEVRQRIKKSNGKRYTEDMINVTAQSAMSKAKRNAIFSVVPRVYVEPIMEEARKVAVGDQKTLGARRTAMLAHFASLGITAAQVYACVGVTGEADITLDKLAQLKGYATAIKTNEVDIDTVFPDPKAAAEPKTGGAAETIKKMQEQARARQQKTAPTSQPEPAPTPQPAADPAQAEVDAASAKGDEVPWAQS
jgi:hypothetical protein